MKRITTPFTATSTADDIVAGLDLRGLRAVVTGASSGIGVETARSLARAGAALTLAVRDVTAGEAVARDITATTGNPQVQVGYLDLADRASIAAFVQAWDGPLDLLINNAGIMAPPLMRTAEGWELQFAVNHLGHFAVTVGLQPSLAAATNARIVAVSSTGHLISPVVFDDIQFLYRPYDRWSAYGQSKTANILFTVEATRRWAQDGIVANAIKPGATKTNLTRYVPDLWKASEQTTTSTPSAKTPQQGAATTLVAAVAPQLAGIGGRCLEDGQEAAVVADDVDVPRGSPGVRQWALDPAAAERLWEVSLELLRTPRTLGS